MCTLSGHCPFYNGIERKENAIKIQINQPINERMNDWINGSINQTTNQFGIVQIPSHNTPVPEHYKDTNKPTLVIKVILLVHIRP